MKTHAVALAALYVSMSISPSHAALTPHYTPDQMEVCTPKLLHGASGDAKKSHRGESVTAKASVTLTAEPGRMLDAREGQIVYTQSGKHLNRPGVPVVTERISNLFPVAITLTSQAHRGQSLSFGRNATAYNAMAVYQVNLTAECIAALGLLKQ
ncbi:MAG: hypothetical protein Q4G49_00630 [Paracoccus sp. (in: a-proteobacteria)]|nr:hypothetical protein [Paracoccus sp. (in: a-proteobacteria)]